MVTVRTCSELAEAQLIKSVLDDSGVVAFVPVQSSVLWSNDEICVQVTETDVDRANEVLRHFDEAESEGRR
jgi:hypothetical protein